MPQLHKAWLGTSQDNMLRQQAKGEVLFGQLILLLPGNSCDIRTMEQQFVCLAKVIRVTQCSRE